MVETPRLLFIDSDAFVLLSGAGLLEMAVAELGFDMLDARRLHPLPFMLAKPRGTLKTYPPAVRQAAIEACGIVPAVTDQPSEQSAAWATDARNVDPGEVVLVALLLEQPKSLLVTGDKRALLEIGTNPALAAVAASLRGRVVCVEALLRAMVSRHGSAKIGTAFEPVRSINGTLKVCFSAACIADEAQCLVAIGQYLDEIDGATGGMLLWRGSDN